jgi:hypothetical protein
LRRHAEAVRVLRDELRIRDGREALPQRERHCPTLLGGAVFALAGNQSLERARLPDQQTNVFDVQQRLVGSQELPKRKLVDVSHARLQQVGILPRRRVARDQGFRLAQRIVALVEIVPDELCSQPQVDVRAALKAGDQLRVPQGHLHVRVGLEAFGASAFGDRCHHLHALGADLRFLYRREQ